jgi:hypothetical protein
MPCIFMYFPCIFMYFPCHVSSCIDSYFLKINHCSISPPFKPETSQENHLQNT